MIKEIFPALVVFVGAGVGGVLRYAVGRATATVSQHFPFSTLGVNLVGSLAMGLIAGWFWNSPRQQRWLEWCRRSRWRVARDGGERTAPDSW